MQRQEGSIIALSIQNRYNDVVDCKRCMISRSGCLGIAGHRRFQKEK